MINRFLTYIAAFVAGFTTWLSFSLVEALNPFLPWQYPILALFSGMSFPGGATPTIHYLNHVAETWFPLLIAFLVARVLTKRRVRVFGAILLYGCFLIWSWVMVLLDGLGTPLQTMFAVGFAGTFFGGAGLYVWLVDPL